MPQLSLVTLLKRLGDLPQQRQPRLGDADEHSPPILGGSAPNDESPFFKLIKHSGHIGRSRNQLVHEAQSRHGAGMSGSEQTQQVVLLGGQFELGEKAVFERAEAVVRPPQGEIRLLLRGIESAYRMARCIFHPVILLSQKIIVQTVIPGEHS